MGKFQHISAMAGGKKQKEQWEYPLFHMGVSENSVPLNTMVNDHYPY